MNPDPPIPNGGPPTRARFPTPPWPDIASLEVGTTYNKTDPITGETEQVEVLSIDKSGPGTVTQSRTV